MHPPLDSPSRAAALPARSTWLCVAWALLGFWTLTSCAPSSSRLEAPSRAVAGATSAPKPGASPATPGTPTSPPTAPRRISAVLLNGGAKPASNYGSHLEHVKRWIQLLQRAGIPSTRITVFASDGADPAADLAIRREAEPANSWLLPDARPASLLHPQNELVSSAVPGTELRPATKASLEAWFDTEGTRLGADDTLLFYVTDHGERGTEAGQSTINLWGQRLTVAELGKLFARLDPGVRVVMAMSQCFSGGFAQLAAPRLDSGGDGRDICGFFSTTADRRAYGCYPESRDGADTGHGFELIAALGEVATFHAAQERILVQDLTPDVPFSTRDRLGAEALDGAARASGSTVEELADRELAQGAHDDARGLVARIALADGIPSPGSLAEVARREADLREASDRLKTFSDRWETALEALRVENFRSFLEANPGWQERLIESRIVALDPVSRERLGGELGDALAAHARRDPERWGRLNRLRERQVTAELLSYRAETRLAGALRMRSILTGAAGAAWIERQGDIAARSALQSLTACEQTSLGLPGVHHSVAELPGPEPLPDEDEDRRLAESVLPGWMGIEFKALGGEKAGPAGSAVAGPQGGSPALGAANSTTPRGAVRVARVTPASPAEAAGLRPGDVILGPPEAPFAEPGRIIEWTMEQRIGEPAELRIERDGQITTVVLRPGPYPTTPRGRPEPVEPGTPAPPWSVDVVRGDASALAAPARRPRLVFFWATWCAVCKAALPDLAATARKLGADPIAISDENPEVVEGFLARHGSEHPDFPELVVTDRNGETTRAWGVTATPTFFLVDGAGRVVARQVGWRKDRGIRLSAEAASP